MTSIQPPDRIVSVDRNGRVRMPAAQCSIILPKFAASGMTWVAFAAHICVKYPTFAGWITSGPVARKVSAEGPAAEA